MPPIMGLKGVMSPRLGSNLWMHRDSWGQNKSTNMVSDPFSKARLKIAFISPSDNIKSEGYSSHTATPPTPRLI